MLEALLELESDSPVLLGEVVELLVLAKVLWVHEAMHLAYHVLLNVRATLEPLVAVYASVLFVDEFSQVLDELLLLHAGLLFVDDEPELFCHLLEVLFKAFKEHVGEQTDRGALESGWWLCLFLEGFFGGV